MNAGTSSKCRRTEVFLELWCVDGCLFNKSKFNTGALSQNKSPIEALTNVKPTYKHLHVFGCICYSKRKEYTKLDSRSEKCIFLGYIPNRFRVLNVLNLKLQHVRDVVFDDTKFFKDLSECEKQNVLNVYGKEIPRLSSTRTAQKTVTCLPRSTTSVLIPQTEHLTKTFENMQLNSDIPDENDYDGQIMPPPPLVHNKRPHSDHPYTQSGCEAVPKSRVSKRSERDYKINNVENNENETVQIDDQCKLDELDRIIQSEVLGEPTVMLTTGDEDVPLNYSDIKNKPHSEQWYKAHENELQAFKRNNSWKLVD